MRRSCRLLAALLLVGCASSPPPPDSAARPESGSEPSCDRVLDLHLAGDHKPAVDDGKRLEQRSVACPPHVAAAVAASRETLRAADQLVRLGLEDRDRGDVDAARTRFEEALALYPKYHWVRSLERALSSHDPELAGRLRAEAAQLRSEDRIEEALPLLERAHRLAPDAAEGAALLSELRTRVAFRHLATARHAVSEGRLDQAFEAASLAIAARPDLAAARRRVAEEARNLGLSLFSSGELVKARSLWLAALQLDRGNPTLLEYLEEVDARLESLAEIEGNNGG